MYHFASFPGLGGNEESYSILLVIHGDVLNASVIAVTHSFFLSILPVLNVKPS